MKGLLKILVVAACGGRGRDGCGRHLGGDRLERRDDRRDAGKGPDLDAAVQQLIMHTGITMDEAKADTLDQIIAKRWQNS